MERGILNRVRVQNSTQNSLLNHRGVAPLENLIDSIILQTGCGQRGSETDEPCTAFPAPPRIESESACGSYQSAIRPLQKGGDIKVIVKGFILEDDQGREFVLTSERLLGQSGSAFWLRGWQRRRLVPLQHTERELRQIIGQILITLDDLFRSLPRLHDTVDERVESHVTSTMPDLKKGRVVTKIVAEGVK